MRTLQDVKRANKAIGHHWFDRGAMSFFGSRIESRLIGERYFVTSEQYGDASPRLYSVREALDDGRIRTLGAFQGFRTLDAALDSIRTLTSN